MSLQLKLPEQGTTGDVVLSDSSTAECCCYQPCPPSAPSRPQTSVADHSHVKSSTVTLTGGHGVTKLDQGLMHYTATQQHHSWLPHIAWFLFYTIRIRWISFITIRPNTNNLFGRLFGPNRIQIEYSVHPYFKVRAKMFVIVSVLCTYVILVTHDFRQPSLSLCHVLNVTV